MINPASTYRLQFHSGFTFSDFEKIIPYLQKLGVKTIYASPVFEATPGSTHGYDALNPHRVNPEIGIMEQWQNISKRLKQIGLYWLQDIVPNHMAFDTRNPWVMDILEKGSHSPWAAFFDVSWNSAAYRGKLMVPFLGSSLPDAVNKGELKLVYDGSRFLLKYFDASYPLRLYSYEYILRSIDKPSDVVQQLLQQVSDARQTEEAAIFSQRFDEIRLQLASLMKNEPVRSSVNAAMDTINRDATLLLQLAEDQLYRLCQWSETDGVINYRRFFTVNGLICLNMQNENVFDHFHSFIKTLTGQRIINGLRIDHIDGLYDPAHYLSRLKKLVGNDTYIVVEKILQQKETMPEEWKIEGSTGYDFLSLVNNLFTNKKSEASFTRFYQELVKDDRTVWEQVRDKKAHILYHHMGGELENLCRLLMISSLVEEEVLKTLSHDILKRTIAEFLIHCPVYRFYGNEFPLKEEEQLAIRSVLEEINSIHPQLSAGVELLQNVFLKKPREANKEYNKMAAHFYQRCMQFSGPLMAKGVEDTLMYTFNRFIAHNEVGDTPGALGISAQAFHEKMKERVENRPLSMNATATHDTKRGEDVRARLNVLSDLPEEWIEKLKEWMVLNEELKEHGVPGVNDEYFLYQSLIGAYPMPGGEEDDFLNRFKDYLQKAVREAKINSNWTAPNQDYEKGIKAFAEKLLKKDGLFWKSFFPFHEQVSSHGITNSLAQVLLKFTCPGVPDTYQGTELWDLSFVDPDNRRAVDYLKRMQWLDELQNNEDRLFLLKQLWQHRFNGKIKLWLVHQLLQERKAQADLFAYGDYIPLQAEGTYKEHVLAFARKLGKTIYIVVLPLHTASLSKEQNKQIENWAWKDTQIKLPWTLTAVQHVLENRPVLGKRSIPVKNLFKNFPVALVKAEVEVQKRGGGILMHISSLPSPFGIGDMGPAAKSFAGFLYRSYQKYWQLLPLNPVESGQGYSPYSSTSSIAGNIVFISPEGLADEGLLDRSTLSRFYVQHKEVVDYSEAAEVKKMLLDEAWKNFGQQKQHPLHSAFTVFCKQEKEWLDDFALYTVLKSVHDGKPWYEWPNGYKHREEKALQQMKLSYAGEMEKIKWMQFVFFRQWKELKNYCNNRGIQLIGDLPFYVSYDSVDVWSHRHLFKLDTEGALLAMAGVPPDAFSEDGQLWGMPVFNWPVLKERNFDWWVKRLKKNTELFDLVRLDHFRAFSAYWEVPAGETTAKNGSWQKGPGAAFFTEVKKALNGLPFIAEDLGDIDPPVYTLRDRFGLPGMNVLQFAFGDDMPASGHTPHNYKQHSVVYTGTHDNNTTVGWYREEKEKVQAHLEKYTGRKIKDSEAASLLCRMAYASVADIAIIPIQDVLGLDERARMNIPSSAGNNWRWRLLPNQITSKAEKALRQWTRIYNRI